MSYFLLPTNDVPPKTWKGICVFFFNLSYLPSFADPKVGDWMLKFVRGL